MRLITSFTEKFKQWQKKRFKTGQPPLWLSVLLTIFIFTILWGGIALGGLRTFIPYFFSLAGSPFSSRSYLIIFQNDAELRPTGGFISAYGVLTINYGFWPHLKIVDVYGTVDDHPYIEPPYPMTDLLANEWYQGYTFRDANWNPDFPSSAEELVSFYQKTNPDASFDGVIAVNFSLIESITRVLGSVDVNGAIFTGDNLFEHVEESVSNVDKHDVEALANRKSILRDFAKTLMKDVILSPLHWRKISDTIVRGLQEKNILLSFSTPSLRRFAALHDWDGAMQTTSSTNAHDFLSLVEANLGGMKSDRYMTRDITYVVDLTGTTPTATITEIFSHYGNYNEPLSGPYTGYVRTYVATGSTNIPSSLHEEGSVGFPGWGEVIRLNPGESTTLSYTYDLPVDVLRDDFYSLFIRKQPGTNNDHIRVTVTLPQGQGIDSDTFVPRESMAYYEDFLTTDLTLSFTVLPDEIGPRVSFQEITGMNRIELHFNEKINGDVAADALNYTIIDMDRNDGTAHDTLSIVEVEHFDKTVVLHTKGMSYQPEEFYRVVLRNILDTHGNFIDPNPRDITVVQRL